MKKREEWIDLAKTLTMILVIIGHSTYYNYTTPYGNFSFMDYSIVGTSAARELTRMLVGFIYAFHMPFFMALSGMTFALSHKPEKPFGKLARSKARRLLIPFVTVTLFMNIPILYMAGWWDNSTNLLYDIFMDQFFHMGNSHLWFILSLFWITLTFACLLKLHFRPNVLFWGLCVAGFFAGCIIQQKGGYFGITGAIKQFIFFALGFFTYRYTKHLDIRWPYIILSWTGMAGAHLILSFTGSDYNYYITLLLSLLLAIWGCINMTITARAMLRPFRGRPDARRGNATVGGVFTCYSTNYPNIAMIYTSTRTHLIF